MPVRDVDHEHVDTDLEQLGGALEIVAARPDGGADSKPALRVARGKRLPLLPLPSL